MIIKQLFTNFSSKLFNNQLMNRLNNQLIELNNNKINSRSLTYFERKLTESNRNEDTKDTIDELLKSNKFNKLYDTHQRLNNVQKLILAVGSSIGALVDPYRDGTIF